MKWMRGYVGLILLILAAYLYAEFKRPPRIDWTVTLDRYDRIPFGTYILYDRLNDIFEVKPEHPAGTVYERYHHRTDTGEVAIFIARNFKTSQVDDEALLRYIALGNTVFLATEDVSAGLADTLRLALKAYPGRFLGSDFDLTSTTGGIPDTIILGKDTVFSIRYGTYHRARNR
jgi:hypothetical protein